jgi:chorismate synthase
MNSFGSIFRVTIWGESHGASVGVSIDGVPAGIALSVDDFAEDLARRASGRRGTTPRREPDLPQIVSGVYEGRTTGAPLTVLFENTNTRSGDYSNLVRQPRPSHADLVAQRKFAGANDPRGGGHFSGRLTLGLVAAGVVAKRVVESNELTFTTRIAEVGGCADESRFDEVIEAAMRECDSVGGVVECRVDNVAVGLGEPFFDSVESSIAHLLFAIPAVKGVEFGAGFEVARRRGSENNDLIINGDGATATNNDGGINGGITNGNQLVVRVAVKPTASIARAQMTYDFEQNQITELQIKGRHDACIALRAAVVVESAVAIALADLWLRHRSRD